MPTTLPRRLSFTPSPDYGLPPTKITPGKRGGCSTWSSQGDRNIKTKTMNIDDAIFTSNNTKGKTPRKCIQTTFKPTQDMKLIAEQAKLLDYVYNLSDPSEIIFKCGQIIRTMKDSDSLSPPKVVETEIYVPIQEAGGHWYLVVVSLVDRVVYHLDSILDEKLVITSHFQIEKVCDALSSIICTYHFPPNYGNGLVEVDKWEIIEPLGENMCGSWSNSPVWVLDWMKMEDSFQLNLFGAINEKVI
ncbi:Ulp1 protease family, C-terminal catalytic domain [Sesbania bispinosa]|nr:Ulp1 protease family, C-terminal catalytic domain [Sesbania bispinosa]